MARGSNRRWKGCQLCKPHKHINCSQAEKKPLPEKRLLGKLKRITRHDLGDAIDAC